MVALKECGVSSKCGATSGRRTWKEWHQHFLELELHS